MELIQNIDIEMLSILLRFKRRLVKAASVLGMHRTMSNRQCHVYINKTMIHTVLRSRLELFSTDMGFAQI